MSDKPKYPRDKALEVANSLVRQLGPWCERIVVAGSLRRGKKEVGDVELLMIPKYLTRTVDLFGDESCNLDLADKTINSYLQSCLIKKRPSKIGVFTWGPKNKLAIHSETGIPVDFFTTNLECWFVALVIRTGSKETNLKLTNGAIAKGGTLHAYGGFTDRYGRTVYPQSEREVFDLCGVQFLAPEER